jgi:hypothetical protein
MRDTVTITTAASVNVASDYKQLKNLEPGPSPVHDQCARVGVTANGAMTGTAKVLRFVLYDVKNAKVRAVVLATITGTTSRENPDGASDGYLCTVAFPNGTDILDLTGADHVNHVYWFVGSPDAFAGGVSQYRVDLFATKQV